MLVTCRPKAIPKFNSLSPSIKECLVVFSVRGHGVVILSPYVGGCGDLLLDSGPEKFAGHPDWCSGHGSFQFG